MIVTTETVRRMIAAGWLHIGLMGKLAYETAGSPQRPAILLVHGFMSCNAQWWPNRDALAREYFLVMVELFGHGQSSEPSTTEGYSVAAYLTEFERIRGELGIDRWALIGQSYGAGLVINYALQYPQCSATVIVTNSRSAFGDIPPPRDESRPITERREIDRRKIPVHPIHARRFPESVKAAMVVSADAMSVEAIRFGGALSSQLNCSESVGHLSAPFLLVNGRFEAVFQNELARLLQRHPNLEVEHLDGGHSVNVEAAAGFDRAVLSFLKREGWR